MDNFTIVVRKTNNGFLAGCSELPGAVASGEKLSDACQSISNIIELYIQNQDKETLPQPDNNVLSEKIIDPDQKLDEISAAKFLKIGRSTLRKLRAKRLIGTFYYCGHAFYSISQLEEFQKRYEVQPISIKTRMRLVG